MIIFWDVHMLMLHELYFNETNYLVNFDKDYMFFLHYFFYNNKIIIIVSHILD